MTSLPPDRRKSPLWESMIFMSGYFEMASLNARRRSLAGAEPGVPCNSKMRALPPVFFWSQSAAMRPSSAKIRAEETGVKRFILCLDVAIGNEDGDFGGLRLAQHRIPAGLDKW